MSRVMRKTRGDGRQNIIHYLNKNMFISAPRPEKIHQQQRLFAEAAWLRRKQGPADNIEDKLMLIFR